MSRRRVHQSLPTSYNNQGSSLRQRSFDEFQPLNSPLSIGNTSHSSGSNRSGFPRLPLYNISDNTLLERSEEQEIQLSNSRHSAVSSESDSGDDFFDPNTMVAPATELPFLPNHSYHRLSRPICLPQYILGQEGKPKDMRIETNSRSAHLAVASLLKRLDGAFIRRSCGKWCYAILAEKVEAEGDVENSKLRFVVDENGSTKNLSFCKWGEEVRLLREPIEVL